tara:strand:- start:32784 stop:33122 length:339 start_codon:yes stop_codon:yes gene_type:complete
MSAEIYSAPSTLEVPNCFDNWGEGYEELETKYINDLKRYIKDMGYKGKNVGEIIKFQVADGYAEYMVLSMRPLKLIHMPLMDSYHFPQVHLMTAKEVNIMLDNEKKLKELFG